MAMLIDLSRPIREGMPVYPGDPPVSLRQEKALSRDHYNAFFWQTGLHAGTHVDAPLHLLPDASRVCDLPLNRFLAQGVLLRDVGSLPEEEIPLGAAVLLETGMDSLYGTPAYYSDHPAVSRELCEYLVSRQVSLVGLDAPSPDFPPFPIHKRLLGAGIPIVENLTRLSALRGREFTFAAFPLLLDAEASPLRAVALLLDADPSAEAFPPNTPDGHAPAASS